MTDIAAIGELLIDFTAEDKSGRLFSANPGGAPANFAAAAAAAGANTLLIAKVGDDAFGSLLRETLRTANVDVSGVIADPDVFTTLAFVSVDAAGERSFSFARKPGADTCLRAEEIAAHLPRDLRALHFGSLSFTDEPARSAVTAAVKAAKKQGVLISYDPNYRAPLWKSEAQAVAAMRWGLEMADVIKLSEEEAAFFADESDPEAAARALRREFGCKLVFLTRGAAGCCFAGRDCSGSVPVPAGISAVDTTGAGDIFGGTALARLLLLQERPEDLTEKDLRAICLYACCAAGLSTETRGGIPSVPAKEKTEKYFEKAMEKYSEL